MDFIIIPKCHHPWRILYSLALLLFPLNQTLGYQHFIVTLVRSAHFGHFIYMESYIVFCDFLLWLCIWCLIVLYAVVCVNDLLILVRLNITVYILLYNGVMYIIFYLFLISWMFCISIFWTQKYYCHNYSHAGLCTHICFNFRGYLCRKGTDSPMC